MTIPAYKKLTTVKLVSILFDRKTRWIEASLNDGTFNATHMLQSYGYQVMDCGIDSRDVRWRIEDFTAFYKDARWRIDQISRR